MAVSDSHSFGELARKIWPFFRKFAAKYSLAILLLVLTGILSLLPPYLVKVLIDSGVKAGRVRIVDAVAIVLLMVTFVSGLARGLMDYIHEWVSAQFIMALRAELFSLVLKQPLRFFSEVKTGDILSRLRSDTTSVYSVLVNTCIGALGELVQIIGIAAFLLYLNWVMALVALAFIPLLHIVFSRFSMPLRTLVLEVRDKDVALLDFLQERIANIQIIKLYHRQSAEEGTHARLSVDLITSILSSVRLRFLSIFLVGILTSGAGIVVLWYGGHAALRGTLSVGSLFAFYLYTVRLYSPIQSLTNRAVEIYSSLASVQRIAEFLDLSPSITEPAKPRLLEGPVLGHITFRNLMFQYPGSDKPLFSNFNLSIYPGQKVALVGPSGAGKTTLVNLIGRLYEATGGSVELDGIDIRKLRFQDLYGSMAFVPQECFLFDATIEENVRYGRDDATLDDVVQACKTASLHEFVESLPQKYQTRVGPRGSHFSGGQRQRLALARLVLKNAPIWVLDEFTSALDSRSESIVHEQLLPLLEHKTAIIIAHRHSTIKVADLVVVIDDGQIKEIGRHEELYSQGGLYKRLFDTQLAADDVCA